MVFVRLLHCIELWKKNWLTEVIDGHNDRGSEKTTQEIGDREAENFWRNQIPPGYSMYVPLIPQLSDINTPGQAKEEDDGVWENSEHSSKEHYGQ